jgi:hypothetical protein
MSAVVQLVLIGPLDKAGRTSPIAYGYQGGRRANGVFSYNQTVNNFGSVHITNVYNETVVNNNVTRVSFNGGSGGVTARPTAEEEAAAREQHVAAIPAQVQQERTAGTNKELLASENHGRPAIAATAKPGEFSAKGVVAAREAAPVGEQSPKPNGAATVPPSPTSTKLIEKEESHEPQETLKEETEPNLKRPKTKPTHEHEEVKRPVDKSEPLDTHAKPSDAETKLPTNKMEPRNAEPKAPRGEAKLPGEKSEPLNTRAKPAEQAPKAAHEPPHASAGQSGRPNPKPPATDKKPE